MSTMHTDYTTPGFVMPISADEQFFIDHAGYSYDPKTETPEDGQLRCARAMRKAERHAADAGWTVTWMVEEDPMWDDDVDREHTDYDQFLALLHDEDGELLASLGCIDLGPNQYPDHGDRTDPYVRVVEADLALEAMSYQTKED